MEVNVVHGTNGFLKKKSKISSFLEKGSQATMQTLVTLINQSPILLIKIKDFM